MTPIHQCQMLAASMREVTRDAASRTAIPRVSRSAPSPSRSVSKHCSMRDEQARRHLVVLALARR